MTEGFETHSWNCCGGTIGTSRTPATGSAGASCCASGRAGQGGVLFLASACRVGRAGLPPRGTGRRSGLELGRVFRWW